MKYILHITLAILLIISPLNSDSESQGVLSMILGKVNLSRVDNNSWTKAKLRSDLYGGDQLKTEEKSRCEIKVADNMIIRVGEKTNFVVTDDLNDSGNINVQKGNVWINLFFQDNDKKVKIRTPTSVASIRGTVYRLFCNSNSSTFKVYDGSVAISPFDETGITLIDTTFIVNPGNELTLVKNFNEYKRQQREEFYNYLKNQRLGFEEYKQQQDEFFEEFKRQEKEAFKKFKGMFIALEKFDMEKDGKSDWVKWNKERDQEIKP